MFTVPLPRIDSWNVWRDTARALLAARIPPQDILWDYDPHAQGLPAAALPPATTRSTVRVPADFLDMARWVVWHKDPGRFARLYALLWRLRLDRSLMADPADPDLAGLRRMERAVRRCGHRMRTDLRFHDLRGSTDRRSFVAWFAPTHHSLEPTAPFFARRFADMDWLIATPDVTARFTGGTLSFHPGQPRPALPDDPRPARWHPPAQLSLTAVQLSPGEAAAGQTGA